MTTPLDFPLLLFIFVATISAGISVFKYGSDFKFVVGIGLRKIMYYLLFFSITNLIRGRRQIRFLLGGLFGLASLTALTMIIQARVGSSVRLLPGRVEAAGQGVGALRILPPGESLVFVMFISAVCAIAIMKKPFFKTIYFYLIPVIGGGLLLTYNRNYYISIIFTFFIFLFLITKKEKKRFLSWVTIVFIFIILIIFPITKLTKTGRVYYDSIAERVSSIIYINEMFVSRSIEWRISENQIALLSIVKHPFLGIGLYNLYRRPLPGDEEGWTGYYVHNGYLWLLVSMGLFGFLPLMWFFLRFLVRGFSKWRKIRDPIIKSAAIGFTLSGIAFSLVNLVSPKLLEWHGIVVIASIIGLNEAIINRNEKELQEDGQ